jgi:hypothetical protein
MEEGVWRGVERMMRSDLPFNAKSLKAGVYGDLSDDAAKMTSQLRFPLSSIGRAPERSGS